METTSISTSNRWICRDQPKPRSIILMMRTLRRHSFWMITEFSIQSLGNSVALNSFWMILLSLCGSTQKQEEAIIS
ncbi:hypothetical protein RDI58_003132 [Solanum bulbocastanum]|uniref:Uncharacterized protein n=1 Tax=Solanum bulbocastanum TaxID=147425 RepID=A0AAN8UH34_SOLBU